MPQTGYTAWSVTVGEQPTTAYWNILGANDSAFNTGDGFNDGIILWRHLDTDIVPTGTIFPYSGALVPSSNWLLCDGSAVSRGSYSALFAVCGTAYGAGDGSTTFNIPNLLGRVPVGLKGGDVNFGVLGESGGESSHALSQGEMPAHSHGVNDPGHSHSNSAAGGLSYVRNRNPGQGAIIYPGAGGNWDYGFPTVNINASGTGIWLSNAGSNQAHNNVQPYTTINYIIKT